MSNPKLPSGDKQNGPGRGARPTPRNVLAAAMPYASAGIRAAMAPANFIRAPKQISMWGNYRHGDCVTAEEAFAKACNSPEIFISDDTVIDWATAHDVLEGAYLHEVLVWMQTGGFAQDRHIYDDGSILAVNWRNASDLRQAIWEGPVKIGIGADQLSATWNAAGGTEAGGKSGWFATGYGNEAVEDHCVSLCGYGTMSWLAGQLKVPVPRDVNGADPGYALFTWDSIGIIDVPSLNAITYEAWLRRPTTVAQ